MAKRSKVKRNRPKRSTPPTTEHIGPVAAMVQAIVERIEQIAGALGSYAAFVLLLTLQGYVALHLSRPDTVLPIFALTLAALSSQTLYWLSRRKRHAVPASRR